MLLGEFLLKQPKEGTPHISGYILAKWGAVPKVPNDFSLPIFSPRVWSLGWDVSRKFEKVFISAVVEGFFVDWCCFVEGFFIVWNLGQSFICRLWKVANNAW